jgi:hypothetical protein
MTVALEKLGEDERIRIAESLFHVTRRAGSDGEIHGLCPIHGEKNPSFSYNVSKDIYHCFSCGASGDLAALWIVVNGGGFRDFLRENGIAAEGGAAESSKYRAPRVASASPATAKASSRPAESAGTQDGVADPALWQKKAAAMVDHAEKALTENTFIMGWLKKRGISKKTAIGMRLGWLDEDRYRHRASWGLEQVLKPDGTPKKLWIPSGLVIPLIERRGDDPAPSVRRIRIRRFADGGWHPRQKPGERKNCQIEPKYYVLPGPSAGCMTHGLPHRAAVVVENWLDGIMLAGQVGDLCAVVALGSASAKPGPALTTVLEECAVILVALDLGDEKHAGAKAWLWWKETFPRARRWPVPAGKDAGEAFAAGHSMEGWIKAGLPPAWFSGPNLERMKNVEGEVPEGERPVAAASAIDELAGLLRKHPVKIRIAPDGSRIYILENQGWKRRNWETSKRIGELVFRDCAVLEHIMRHGAEIIDGKNIMPEQSRPKLSGERR